MSSLRNDTTCKATHFLQWSLGSEAWRLLSGAALGTHRGQISPPPAYAAASSQNRWERFLSSSARNEGRIDSSDVRNTFLCLLTAC